MNYGFIGGLHQYRIRYFPQLYEKSYFSYSLNFTESFKLPHNCAYNSSSYDGNSRSNGNAIFNLGFKKELNNQNGSFQLSFSDIFRAAKYYSLLGLLTTDTFDSNVGGNYQAESHSFPVVKLSYSRSLGSTIKKTSHKNMGTKEEQDRL